MAASSRGSSVSSRARPGASSRRNGAGAAELEQQLRRRVPHRRSRAPASAAANCARRRAAQPRFGDAVDAGHLGGRRVVAREHDFLERARDARAMQLELGAAGSQSRKPIAAAMRSRVSASSGMR